MQGRHDKLDSFDGAAFDLIEEKIYADAVEAARTPDHAPQGSLIPVTRKDSAGREITSYLQRYTLLMVTGLATKDINPDDDGAGSGPIIDGEPTEAEKVLADWLAKLDEVSTLEDLGKASKAGAKAFRDAKDRKGYAAFAKAVQARGKKLRGEADHA